MYKLYKDPVEYANYHFSTYSTRAKVYKFLYISLNVLILLATMATSIITTLMISHLVWDGFPDWFFFFSAGAGALTAFFTSMINFFVIKTQMKELRLKKELIYQELLLYNNKLTYKYARMDRRDFYLFNSISRIVGSESAQKVGGYDQ